MGCRNSTLVIIGAAFEIGAVLLALWTGAIVVRARWRTRTLRSENSGGSAADAYMLSLTIRTLLFIAVLTLLFMCVRYSPARMRADRRVQCGDYDDDLVVLEPDDGHHQRGVRRRRRGHLRRRPAYTARGAQARALARAQAADWPGQSKRVDHADAADARASLAGRDAHGGLEG
jgi:hypothetical protein